MTEKEIITKLQILKDIEPRKDWALLVKSQILGEETIIERSAEIIPWYREALSAMKGLLGKRQFAYAFSVMVFVFAGLLGFAQYTLPGDVLFSVKKITDQSLASLTGESNVKSNFETLKKRSQDLAVVVKNNKESNVSSAVQEVKDATQSLTDAIQKDPTAAKELALEIKNNGTLLNITEETELKVPLDTLYKVIGGQIIDDVSKNTLNEKEQKTFDEAKMLYDDGKYYDAFEKIMEIEK